ncbi:CapA family protein [uncultured Subdoligranulum sp.]|uniref:CapA family protein n=1 Tax=uncultured Subdoligranulum sp. TaxID=512298 RepID=UPI002631DE58|nr:CapA family protein [uncultured Subdoligranulum sp.]
MRLRGNEIAACVVIALGVSGVLLGSVFQEPLQAQATAVAAAVLPTPTPVPTPAPTPAPTPEPTPTVETVRFSATGDNLIHDGIYLQALQRGEDGYYDFSEAYEPMREFYTQFDVNWLNQETLVNDAFEPSGYPRFSTPGDITDALYDLGFRVFSLSNNHSYDKGAEGIASSLEHWSSLPEDVAYMGFYNLETYDDYVYQTVNGITFGYLSYTEYTNGLPTPEGTDYGVVYLDDRERIARQIQDMRPNCDVLVVSCHWGVEGSHETSDFQTETAQWLADQGVDLIIGTHPHVTQTAQWLTGAGGNQAFVAYSLGNFINAQSQPDNMIGAVLDITFQKTTQPDGTVQVEMLDPKLHGVVTQYEAGYKKIRVYPFADYTDELGAAHGQFTLSRAEIEQTLRDSIDGQFLTLE